VDFVLIRNSKPYLALECKWSTRDFDPRGAKAFSMRYPQARICVVAQDVERPFAHDYAGTTVNFLSLEKLIQLVRREVLR